MPDRLLRNPTLIFLAAAAILVAVGVWGVVSAVRFTQDGRFVLQTVTVLRHLDDVATFERQAVASQRGYLLVEEPDLRDEFWDAKARVRQHAEELRELLTDDVSKEEADALTTLIATRMDLAARTVGVYERQGLATAQAFIRSNGSRGMDRRIGAMLTALRARETAKLAERRAALESSAQVSLLSVALGIPLSLLMLALVNRLLVRQNAERRRIADAAEASATELRRLSNDMRALGRFAGMLQSCESVDELLTVSAQGFSALAPDVAGTVFLLRASRDHAEAAATWGQHAVSGDEHPLPGDCWAVRRNQPHHCPDVADGLPCPHIHAMVGRTAATLCLPLTAQGEAIGWVTLSRAGAAPIAEYDLLPQAAEPLSLALANLRLRQDLRNQSIRDPLTGLFNRRYLEESLTREISRCTRRGLPLAVLMFDVDHFKAFNDRHGHPGGDALLAAFGHLLQAHCRNEDIPCRFGGEEFTLILPEATQEVATTRAQALLAATEALEVTHHGVALSKVTTSVGLAMLPAHGTTATALVGAADAALYRAKAEGRNRLRVAATPPADEPLRGASSQAG